MYSSNGLRIFLNTHFCIKFSYEIFLLSSFMSLNFSFFLLLENIHRRTCKNTIFIQLKIFIIIFFFSSFTFVVGVIECFTYSRYWLTILWNSFQCIRRLKSHLKYTNTFFSLSLSLYGTTFIFIIIFFFKSYSVELRNNLSINNQHTPLKC